MSQPDSEISELKYRITQLEETVEVLTDLLGISECTVCNCICRVKHMKICDKCSKITCKQCLTYDRSFFPTCGNCQKLSTKL